MGYFTLNHLRYFLLKGEGRQHGFYSRLHGDGGANAQARVSGRRR